MNEADSDRWAAEISRSLPGTPQIKITGIASVGAQRQTLFLELTENPGGKSRPAVAQIAAVAIAAAEIEVEAQLLRAAARGGVPVPEVLAVDPELQSIVSAHVAGETIPRKILRWVEANPGLGAQLASDSGKALAAIHRIPLESLPTLEAFADGHDYVRQQEEHLDMLSVPYPTFRLGLRWLERHVPSPIDSPVLVHGDFRLGNIIATEAGLASVLDWELAHLGDPMEDLAWLCLRTWRFGNDANEVGGFGGIADLRRAYEAAGGEWRAEAFAWWTVARTLWWGLGLARQAQAFLDGASDSIVLAASGRRVAELEYDLLKLIGP